MWVDGDFHPIEKVPAIIQIDGDYANYGSGVGADGSLWAWGISWDLAVYPDPMPEFESTFGPERFEGHQINLNDVGQVSADGVNMALDKHGTVWAWG